MILQKHIKQLQPLISEHINKRKLWWNINGREIAAYAESDYVLANQASRFVVDAFNPQTGVCSGPGRANDYFDMVTCYLNFNPARKLIELLTRTPLGPDVYEALVNYDHLDFPPRYWSEARRARLPPDSLACCLSYYSPACIQRARRSVTGPQNIPLNYLGQPRPE